MEPGVKRVSIIYILYKVRSIFFKCFYRKAPLWSKEAVKFAEKLLRETDSVLEFGSGRSTIWFASICKNVVSIEHDKKWVEKVQMDLKSNGLSDKVILKYLPLIQNLEPCDQPYVSINEIKYDRGFDIVLIDGKLRDHSTLAGLKFLKSNGILIIDDVHRYLPLTKSTEISKKDNLKGDWSKVWEIIKNWREIRTTDGIHETSFFFKS